MSQAGSVNPLQGPSSTTAGTVPVFSDTSGKRLSDTSVTIDSSNNMIVPGDLTVSYSSSGSQVLTTVSNQSNTANSSSNLQIVTAGSSSGNPSTQFTVLGVKDWVVGIDNSASQSFKISNSGALGTGDALVIGTNYSVTIPSGSLTLTAGTLNVLPTAFNAGLTNGQLLIGSTGNNATAATLTAGTNMVITPGAGSISIATTTTPIFNNTTVNNLTTQGNTIFPNNSRVGFVNITTSSTSVSASGITANSYVFLTPSGSNTGGIPYVDGVTPGVGFNITIPSFVPGTNFNMSWMIIDHS